MTKGVFIIAEAGVNHNGSVELAKNLIDVAADCGADAVKFQTFKTGLLVTEKAPKAGYQEKQTGNSGGQFEMLKKLELSEDDHKVLISYAEVKGIRFLSTPFDHDSIDLLHRLGLSTVKIGSGDLTNLPYLRKIGKTFEEVILSTGMSSLKDVSTAVKALLEAGLDKTNLIILHANTDYPTPFEDVNLRAMITLADELGVRVGYSDHTPGIEVPVAAVAMGASVIEKHFTLSRTMEGPDHAASLEPDELKGMIRAIRNVELALGDGVKKPSFGETKNMLAARKSIVAKKDISRGEIFTEENLTVKRPGSGISPFKWDEIIGEKAEKDYKKDDLI